MFGMIDREILAYIRCLRTKIVMYIGIWLEKKKKTTNRNSQRTLAVNDSLFKTKQPDNLS